MCRLTNFWGNQDSSFVSAAEPMEDDLIIGRDSDGTLNEKYCKWCYDDGVYTYNNMNELIDVCAKNMANENFTEEKACS